MEVADILNTLSMVPSWVWVVGAIVFVFFVFGESIVWDYEVKFPFNEGVGRGKVELECGKRKGTRIGCVFELNPSYQHIPLDVFVGETKIYTIPSEKNRSNRFSLRQNVPLDEPQEGDLVIVKAHDETIFSGPLVLD
ncbi:MAG TPA: hypothetical protein VKP65_13540 [Rhodothermales bacterium]|nr:hypothetical protein [Rhodothermales bacterium]